MTLRLYRLECPTCGIFADYLTLDIGVVCFVCKAEIVEVIAREL